MERKSEFLSELFFIFLVVKFSVYLNRYVFVMQCTELSVLCLCFCSQRILTTTNISTYS